MYCKFWSKHWEWIPNFRCRLSLLLSFKTLRSAPSKILPATFCDICWSSAFFSISIFQPFIHTAHIECLCYLPIISILFYIHISTFHSHFVHRLGWLMRILKRGSVVSVSAHMWSGQHPVAGKSQVLVHYLSSNQCCYWSWLSQYTATGARVLFVEGDRTTSRSGVNGRIGAFEWNHSLANLAPKRGQCGHAIERCWTLWIGYKLLLSIFTIESLPLTPLLKPCKSLLITTHLRCSAADLFQASKNLELELERRGRRL